MTSMSRREFLGRTLVAGTAAGAATLASSTVAKASAGEGRLGTFIDLTQCQGCGECVTACRTKNAEKFPKPVDDIPVNWPTGKMEDWSDKKGAIDKLTPYNWLYVEKVEVDGRTLTIPRRCMHCDEPACVSLCPFSASEKTADGPVVIDHDKCLGGAKCKSVCPWSIPQRQAGVGLYMKLAPGLLGGGVMYKCDGCADVVAEGGVPACVSACPTGAVRFGDKDEMRELAKARAEEIGGHIYGAEENGGTSTFYVSPVPFEAIDAAIAEKKKDLPKKLQGTIPGMKPNVENYMGTANGMAAGYAIAPIAGVAAAAVAAFAALKGDSE